ncbi:MAG: hypothetical protein JOZ05_03215 [Acetobacteraceae bacterium]|nr:hypothetical protein [Acetobacteraceae bacterium]
MRNVLAAAMVLAAGLSFSQPSAAATRLDPGLTAGSGITLVEGGCGPGFFRAPNGYCYRGGYRPPPPPPPPGYYRRPCPPGYHPTPYGCRPNW